MKEKVKEIIKIDGLPAEGNEKRARKGSTLQFNNDPQGTMMTVKVLSRYTKDKRLILKCEILKTELQKKVEEKEGCVCSGNCCDNPNICTDREGDIECNNCDSSCFGKHTSRIESKANELESSDIERLQEKGYTVWDDGTIDKN